jgi:CHAT domain-containing protein
VGEKPDAFARRIVDTASTMGKDPTGLFDFLVGSGRNIADKIPAWIRSALAAVSEAAGDRVPAVLIVSEDPYIPWELAVIEPPLVGAGDGSPFLGAQVAVGRWPLTGDRPPPRPDAVLRVVERAVVSGEYDRVAGFERLEGAEGEAEALAKAWPGARSIDASYPAVREALRGEPAVDLLHFALHGQFAPEGLQDGLVLIHPDPDDSAKPPRPYFLRPEQVRAGGFGERVPFVFLNACQVGAGSRVLGDYAGMAESFLAIGAGSVVAPLWSVDDEVARRAAEGFYADALGAGAGEGAERPSAAEVLRRARARFTGTAVKAGEGEGASTYLAYQYFGHPRLALRVEPDQ